MDRIGASRAQDGEIVVSGVGCLCALGANFPECMENLFLGQQNIGYPTRFSPGLPEKYPVFEVNDRGICWPQHLRNRGRTAQLAVVAATEALATAGYTPTALQGKRVGVCIGTTVGNSMNNEELYRLYHSGQEPAMTEMDRYFCSNPAEVVAMEYGLRGPVLTVANACSSGADAIGIARSWLQADLCDVVLAGGSDELSHISYLGFIALMISSQQPCRPFDRKRQGLNLGEGAALFVLERVTSKAHGKCVVSAYASRCDAYHVAAPHPDGLGLRLALTAALVEAGTDDIAFINAHGTGTLDNDRVEMTLLAELFENVPYFSVKGCTGHTLGAAGAIEAAITVGCLMHEKIPASVGFAELPTDATKPPLTAPLAILGGYALSQSLAFGGNNSVLIFHH